MKTYWILDMRSAREITRLRLEVFGERHPILGMNEVSRTYDEEQHGRYLVFDFDSNAVDLMGLEPGRKGCLGPYDSREEAETIAQRLNTGD